MPPPVLRCPVEDVADWYPQLFVESHIVACAAITGRYSGSPAAFAVECDGIGSDILGHCTCLTLELWWTHETEEKANRLRLTVQAKPLVEMAAVAVALVLLHRVARLGRLDVTAYGHRADYRSLDPPRRD